MLFSVKSRSVTTPPDPDDASPENRPAVGDAYIAISGTWPASGVPLASIGLWTTLGGGSWAAIAPVEGMLIWVKDEAAYVHYEDSAGWVDGIGNNAIASGTVPPSALIWDGRVQDQTHTAPPSTWSKGVAYVAAASSTGDWAGFDGSVMLALTAGVLADGGTFTRIVPYDGFTVYDIALGYDVRWNAADTAWKKFTGNFTVITSVFGSTGLSNWTKPDGCFAAEVFGIGAGGGGADAADNGNDGGDTTFGSHVTFHGGVAGHFGNGGGDGGAGGTGTGDHNWQGGDGANSGGVGGESYGEYGSLSWPVHAYGKGGNGQGTGGGGGAGCYGKKWIDGEDLSNIEVVDVGIGGAGHGSATSGIQGYLVVRAYVTK